MDNPETYEERIQRWVKFLDDKIGKDLDNLYDETQELVSNTDCSRDFKPIILDATIQTILIRLQYEADCRFSQRQQVRN